MPQPPIDLVRSIVLRASELPAEQREGFVLRECGQDEALGREVRSFLSQVDGAERANSAATPSTPSTPPALAGLGGLGAQIGAPAVDAFPGYRLVRELGRGGNGVVYLAQAVRAGQAEPHYCAIKLLSSWLATPTATDRLRREGAALQRLDHAGIARWLETGTIRRGGSDQLYLVLEYIEGKNLRDYLATIEARARPEEALSLFVQIADAVAHAHAQGVVHRDLKPENVIVDSQGRARVIDFGLARLLELDSESAALTQAGQIVGTLGYLSPEQADPTRGPSDARSDVYALGVVGYEMLTGALPYPVDGAALSRSLRSIVEAEPIPASSVDRTLRGNLDWILSRALEKEPKRRYADAGALSADLRRHFAGERLAPRAVGLRRFVRRTLHDPRRRAHALAVAGLSAVVLSVGIAVIRSQLDQSNVETKLQTLFGLVEEMDSTRRTNEAVESELYRAISMIHRADSLLTQIPPQPYTPDFRYYLRWREGELHYFLANLTGDLTELDKTERCWYDAGNVQRIPGALSHLETQSELEARMAADPASTPLSGLGMLAQTKAAFEAPRLNLLHARECRKAALEKLEAGPIEVFSSRLTTVPPDVYHRSLAQAQAELAGTCVGLAALEDEPSSLSAGLRLFHLAESSGGFRRYWEPYSALQLQRGRGYWVRARDTLRTMPATASPHAAGRHAPAMADLDSARLYLPVSLADGDNPSPRERARLAIELAECDRLEAQLVGNAAPLESARARLDAAWNGLTANTAPSVPLRRDILRVQFARAQVLNDLAQARRDPRLLGSAESCLLEIAANAVFNYIYSSV